MDAPLRRLYAQPMPESALRERWFDVSLAEFEAFLREYPRPLEVCLLLGEWADHREWVDPSIGTRPCNAVGKSWRDGGFVRYQICLDLVLRVSAQAQRGCQWCAG
jgi:hypothetical protein